jgi:hypothetical protein
VRDQEKRQRKIEERNQGVKKKATQSQKISLISILKAKIQKKKHGLGERSDSAPEATIELSPEHANHKEKPTNYSFRNLLHYSYDIDIKVI